MFLKSIILTVFCFNYSMSCSCSTEITDETIFCSSDFVARINVLDNGSLFYHNGTKHDEIVFRVKFNKIYKGCDVLKTVNHTNTITTPQYGTSCGVADLLHQGRDYLIDGIVRYDDAWVFSCGFISEWNFVHPDTKHNLDGNKFSDDCSSNPCPNGLHSSTAQFSSLYPKLMSVLSFVILTMSK